MNQEFLLRIDCKFANSVLQKDVKTIAFKHILFIYQAILSNFPPKEIGQSSRISIQGSRTSSPPRQYFKVNSQRLLVKLDNVDFRPNIPHPRYVMQDASPPTLPTPSQMLLPDEPHQLMVIDEVTKPFQIDKEYLSKELHLSKHREKREWFFFTKLITQARHMFRD